MNSAGSKPALFALQIVVLLDCRDFFGLQPFLSLYHAEFDLLPFLQRTETFSLDLAEVDEDILAGGTLDEAVTFSVVEPFHRTDFSISHKTQLIPVS